MAESQSRYRIVDAGNDLATVQADVRAVVQSFLGAGEA